GLCVSSHPPCRFTELSSRPHLSPARRPTTNNSHPTHPSLALCPSPPRTVSKTTLSLATTLCSPSAVLAGETTLRTSLLDSEALPCASFKPTFPSS
ncbi:hypothetical protein C8F01DRAFT_1363348, partial [Mycena amicta]